MFQAIISSNFLLLLPLFRDRKKIVDIDANKEQEIDENLLCRFVVDGKGNRIGESVSLDGDIIIIKSSSKYLGVPLKHIENEGKHLLVKGLIDFDRAELIGEQWRKESFCEMKNPTFGDEDKSDEF